MTLWFKERSARRPRKSGARLIGRRRRSVTQPAYCFFHPCDRFSVQRPPAIVRVAAGIWGSPMPQTDRSLHRRSRGSHVPEMRRTSRQSRVPSRKRHEASPRSRKGIRIGRSQDRRARGTVCLRALGAGKRTCGWVCEVTRRASWDGPRRGPREVAAPGSMKIMALGVLRSGGGAKGDELLTTQVHDVLLDLQRAAHEQER